MAPQNEIANFIAGLQKIFWARHKIVLLFFVTAPRDEKTNSVELVFSFFWVAEVGIEPTLRRL